MTGAAADVQETAREVTEVRQGVEEGCAHCPVPCPARMGQLHSVFITAAQSSEMCRSCLDNSSPFASHSPAHLRFIHLKLRASLPCLQDQRQNVGYAEQKASDVVEDAKAAAMVGGGRVHPEGCMCSSGTAHADASAEALRRPSCQAALLQCPAILTTLAKGWVPPHLQQAF